MYSSLKEIPNPYDPYHEIKQESSFIGRKRELNKIKKGLKESIKTGVNKNYLIVGDKSIGKSSLLHILAEQLKEENFLTVYFEINKNKIVSNLIFFKELFDSIINEGSPNDLLNSFEEGEEFTQKEIWESLIIDGRHESTNSQRKILLANFYASALDKDNFTRPLPESYLLKDFEYIVSEIIKTGYNSLVIMIDEFQLLKENDAIIQNLLVILEKINGASFIFCGNEKVKTDTFDKALRKLEILELKPFNRNEIWDFIYKPIMHYGFTKDEINTEIDRNSLENLIRTNEINPYYLNLILCEMFDRYKQGLTSKIEFNHDISSSILDKLKHSSQHHEKISSQLNVATPQQLEALKKLYKFQNLNFDDIVISLMAFDEFSDEKYNLILGKIVNDVKLILPLGLFVLEKPDGVSLDDLVASQNKRNYAAQIKYKFIGDAVDELFLASYIQNALNKELKIGHFPDALSILNFKLEKYLIEKFSNELDFLDNKIISSFREIEKAKENEFSSNIIEEKIKTLNTIKENETIDYKIINDSLSDTSLNILPYMHNFIRAEFGYLYIFTKAKIREKIFIYEFIIPSLKQVEQLPIYFTDNLKNSVFSNYNVEIIESIVTYVKPQIIGILSIIDIESLVVSMQRSVLRKNYDETIRLIEILKSINQEEKDNHENNLGFISILKKEYQFAEKCFELVKNKEFTTFLNMSYLYYIQNTVNINKVKSYLKKAEKSFRKIRPNEPIFFAIHQILLPVNERKKINSSTFDLIFEVSIDLVIKGNNAVIASFEKQNFGIGLLNNAKIINKNNDEFYKKRYEYYIYYNLGDIEKAKELIVDAENIIFNNNTTLKKHFEELIEFDKTIIK